MEEGKVQLEMTALNIKESIAKVNSTLAGAQVTKSLHLERTVDESMPDHLMGDRYRVEHVLINPLSNAIKVSPERGSIRIHIAAEAEANSMTNVTASITDNGPPAYRRKTRNGCSKSFPGPT